MKFLDEKGRLFGKINIIDLLIILFFISFLPLFYFSYKMLFKTAAHMDFMDVEINCKFIKLKPEVLKLISVGDTGLDKTGNPSGEIVWLGNPKPYHYEIDIGAEEPQIIEDTVLEELPVKIKLRVGRSGKYIYYLNEQVNVNNPFIFVTQKYRVTSVALSNYREKWVNVRVRFSGMSAELSNLINKGHIEKDTIGRIIGKLTEVISNTSAQVSALKIEENKFVFVNDPYRNDIVARLEILCVEKDGGLYFKNYPVKIGGQITFASDLYVLTGTIIGIDNK